MKLTHTIPVEVPDNDAHFTLCSDCTVPLQPDFSRHSKEWWCPECGRFTAMFDDGHIQTIWKKMQPEAQSYWLAKTGRLKQLQRYEREGVLSLSGERALKQMLKDLGAKEVEDVAKTS